MFNDLYFTYIIQINDDNNSNRMVNSTRFKQQKERNVKNFHISVIL